jgi:hypothetical protein
MWAFCPTDPLEEAIVSLSVTRQTDAPRLSSAYVRTAGAAAEGDPGPRSATPGPEHEQDGLKLARVASSSR